MSSLRSIVRVVLFAAMSLTVAALGALAAPRNPAESTVPSEAAPRVQGSAEDGARVVLTGNVLPLVQGMGRTGVLQSAIDQGAVEDSLPAGRMLLLLQGSPAQEGGPRGVFYIKRGRDRE